jgi:hypothetical protein
MMMINVCSKIKLKRRTYNRKDPDEKLAHDVFHPNIAGQLTFTCKYCNKDYHRPGAHWRCYEKARDEEDLEEWARQIEEQMDTYPNIVVEIVK